MQRGADRQPVPVAAGSLIIENPLIFVDFVIIAEKIDDCIITFRAKRINADRNLAAGKTLGDNESFRRAVLDTLFSLTYS